MTWLEFKAEVDKQLVEKGINPEIELNFIDVSFACTDDVIIFLEGGHLDIAG